MLNHPDEASALQTWVKSKVLTPEVGIALQYNKHCSQSCQSIAIRQKFDSLLLDLGTSKNRFVVIKKQRLLRFWTTII